MAEPLRILLASVLKPVDDPRMVLKIGRSLQQHLHTEVHIAGFRPTYPVSLEGLQLHPIFDFPRLSFQRSLANFRLFGLISQIKPDLLIIGTHELLPAASLAKMLTGCKVIYDVRENYYRNIRHTPAFPSWLRNPLSGLVRKLENVQRPFIDHYFLAEQAYAREIDFSGADYTILENKAMIRSSQRTGHYQIKPEKLQLVFTGTIAVTYGIFEAINLAKILHQIQNTVTLLIIGYAPQAEVLQKVREQIRDFPFIRLEGGSELVPHQKIAQAIAEADVGLIAYQPNPSTENCIPTKLFEYLAAGLPVISQNNPLWADYLKAHKAGISINYSDFDPAHVLQQLHTQEFYPEGNVEEALWESEVPKLLGAVNQVMRNQIKDASK